MSRVGLAGTREKTVEAVPGRGPAAKPVRKVMVTPVGLRIPDRMGFDAWEQVGYRIAQVANCSAWCLGDWLVYGSYKYGERYRLVIPMVNLEYQTLRNYAWVARRFDISRRRENLSFQHHAEVAGASVEEQDHWLDLAQRDGWSRSDLRRNIRLSRSGAPGQDDNLILPRLCLPAEQVVRWRDAARQTNLDFEDWIVAALDRSATRPPV